jgi:hypothetical protein
LIAEKDGWSGTLLGWMLAAHKLLASWFILAPQLNFVKIPPVAIM